MPVSFADTSICARPAKQQQCLYYPGMIVWAKITGYSYWPAMIDNDPDFNSYTWPVNSSDLVSKRLIQIICKNEEGVNSLFLFIGFYLTTRC